MLQEKSLELFVVEISLDGSPEYHDVFRGAPGAFNHAMESYRALEKMQEVDPRLRIHAVSTATSQNIDEIKRLTALLYEQCPRMDHHNLAIIRGDRKNPALLAPDLKQYQELYTSIRQLWARREASRYGAIVEPMLQWAKIETIQKETQVIPCRAGRLSAVVYANGDVSVCELHPPLGNLRQKSFWEIWDSPEAHQLRQSIAHQQCHCTTEVFLWPSIVFQPVHLVKTMLAARALKKPPVLD